MFVRQKETFKYNLKGQLIEKLDKDGCLTKFGYTAHGDVNHIQYADGKEVKMRYNPLRQLIEVQDWLGKTNIEVDSLGRTTKTSNHQGKEVSYTWGAKGERRSLTYPDGKTVTYDYDDLLRLSEVNDGKNVVTYQYNSQSKLREKLFQNGMKTTCDYDDIGRLQELTHFGGIDGNEVLDKYQYSYDLMGNRIAINKERKLLIEDTGLFEYKYDPLNRIQEVIKDGNLIREYGYDSYGNRSSLKNGEVTTNYAYNSLNQLISSVDSHDTGESNKHEYSYDGRGNLIKMYKNNQLTHQYHFGATNRLESVFNHEKQLGATYRYNGLGHRVGKTEGQSIDPALPTNINHMSLNPTKQIEDVIDFTRQYNNLLQREENQELTSYIWDLNVLSTVEADGSSYSYLQDNLGSPLRLLDESGMERDIFGYDEFGQHLQSVDIAKEQPFTYTGYQRDHIAGTYFAQAREYQPNIGRFTAEDSVKGLLAVPMTMTPYAYCFNSPLNFVDLNGEWGRLADGLESLRGAAQSVNNAIHNAGVAVADAVTQVGNHIGSGIQQAGEFIGNQVSSAFEGVGNAVSTAGHYFGTGMQVSGNFFGCGFTYNLGGQIVSASPGIGNAITDVGNRVGNQISSGIGFIGDVAEGTFGLAGSIIRSSAARDATIRGAIIDLGAIVVAGVPQAGIDFLNLLISNGARFDTVSRIVDGIEIFLIGGGYALKTMGQQLPPQIGKYVSGFGLIMRVAGIGLGARNFLSLFLPDEPIDVDILSIMLENISGVNQVECLN